MLPGLSVYRFISLCWLYAWMLLHKKKVYSNSSYLILLGWFLPLMVSQSCFSWGGWRRIPVASFMEIRLWRHFPWGGKHTIILLLQNQTTFCPLDKESLGTAVPEEVINWESKLASKINCHLEQCFDTWGEVRVWGGQEAGGGWEGEESQRMRGVKRKAASPRSTGWRMNLLKLVALCTKDTMCVVRSPVEWRGLSSPRQFLSNESLALIMKHLLHLRLTTRLAYGHFFVKVLLDQIAMNYDR